MTLNQLKTGQGHVKHLFSVKTKQNKKRRKPKYQFVSMNDQQKQV